MRIHILGICGTFMAGCAVLACESGMAVSGSDMNIYPPMSTQLKEAGITLFNGYDPKHLDLDEIDCVVVGNAIKRGNPALEYILAKGIYYTSGPAWLFEQVLKKRWVLAVAGTHGKTTTSSMVAWILEKNKREPGFLIGGVPQNFGISAKLGGGKYFVVEADEYDAAFFDKRSKFVHYRPKTLVLNNLEYDHADIFPNLAAIQLQFHHLVRTVPPNGCIIYPQEDANLENVLAKGCWTPLITLGNQKANWQAKLVKPDGQLFDVFFNNKEVGRVEWDLLGAHNVHNALAAIAAVHHIEITPQDAVAALSTFQNVKRRMEVRANLHGIAIYDDFAHHPTAIQTTLAGLRAHVGKQARIIAILEFGSYTMRAGVHKEKMAQALSEANLVYCKKTELDWGMNTMLADFKQPTHSFATVNDMVEALTPTLLPGDHVIIMSNSGFDGMHQKLISAIEKG
ncbi:MAG: UDP-N-acetylmuramate:L-alanyl-gamma-D-glutamyl-meso-diaminopimelate ligase [Gammaproteobacteria bacterium]|nr:UDP-N-acetylmuramate:L-alanyl-gamma-D-glutamyl-meso-diaminopimelate ligase [Gammaproteobacteria bacterium]